MTSPIKPKKAKAGPASTEPRRTWCCGTPVTAPHVQGCAYEPNENVPVDYTGPADVVEPHEAPEPPPAPTQGPVAAQRAYGITRRQGEADLELPSGDLIRYRKLNKSSVLRLNLVEVLDGFTPELLSDVGSDDAQTAQSAAVRALADPERNAKIFGPIDRVVAAAVVIPTVVLVGPTTDTQINVDEIELEDKVAIFIAAIGEQLDALKSVRNEPADGV